jgi:allantoinase
VVGFKAFMSASGTDDFRHAGDDTLYQGMVVAARHNLPVAVHAENDAITADLARRARAEGRTGMRDYLASRPVVAEVEAIGRAITLAEATGCALHIVHVSTGQGVVLVAEARASNVDVTCETCPHYLAFDEDDAERIGALSKCAPPLRSREVRDALWHALLEGDVDMLASDHSPAPPSMKTGDDAFGIWGGISGCQHLAPAMLTMAQERGLEISDLTRLLSNNAARRFELEGKGDLVPGGDADLALWRPQSPAPIERVQYRHPASAWDGFPMAFGLERTILRGEVVWQEGIVGQPRGRLITPRVRG